MILVFAPLILSRQLQANPVRAAEGENGAARLGLIKRFVAALDSLRRHLLRILLHRFGEKRDVIQTRLHIAVNGIELNLQRSIRIIVLEHDDVTVIERALDFESEFLEVLGGRLDIGNVESDVVYVS